MDTHGSDAIGAAKALYQYIICDVKEGQVKNQLLSILNLRGEIEQCKTLFDQITNRKLMLNQHVNAQKNITYDEARVFLQTYIPTKLMNYEQLTVQIYQQLLVFIEAPVRIQNAMTDLVETINDLLRRTSDDQLMLFSDKKLAYDYAVKIAFYSTLSHSIDWLSSKQAELKVRIQRLEYVYRSVVERGSTIDDVEKSSANTDEFINAPIRIEELQPLPKAAVDRKILDEFYFGQFYHLDELVMAELPLSMQKYPMQTEIADKIVFAAQRLHERHSLENIDLYRRDHLIRNLISALLRLYFTLLQKKDLKDDLQNLSRILNKKYATYAVIDLIQGLDVPLFLQTLASSIDDSERNTMLGCITTLIMLLSVTYNWKSLGFNPWSSMVSILFLVITGGIAYKALEMQLGTISLLASCLTPSMLVTPLVMFQFKDSVYKLYKGEKIDIAPYSRLLKTSVAALISKTTDNISTEELESLSQFINQLPSIKSASNDSIDTVWLQNIEEMTNSADKLKKIFSDPDAKRRLFGFMASSEAFMKDIREVTHWRHTGGMATFFDKLSYSTQSVFYEMTQYHEVTKETNTSFLYSDVSTNFLRIITNAPHAISLGAASFIASLGSTVTTTHNNVPFWASIVTCIVIMWSSSNLLLHSAEKRKARVMRSHVSNRRINTMEDTSMINTSPDRSKLQKYFFPYDNLFQRIQLSAQSIRESRYAVASIIRMATNSMDEKNTLRKIANKLLPESMNEVTDNLFDSMMSTLFWSSVAGIVTTLGVNASVGELISTSLTMGSLTSNIIIPSILDHISGSVQAVDTIHTKKDVEKDAFAFGQSARNLGHRTVSSLATLSRALGVVLPYTQQFNLFDYAHYWQWVALGILALDLPFHSASKWLEKEKMEYSDIGEIELYSYIHFAVQCIAIVWADGVCGNDGNLWKKMPSTLTLNDDFIIELNKWIETEIIHYMYGENNDKTDTFQESTLDKIKTYFFKCKSRLTTILNKNPGSYLSNFNNTYTLTDVKRAFNLASLKIPLNRERLLLVPFCAIIPLPKQQQSSFPFARYYEDANKNFKLPSTLRTVLCDALIADALRIDDTTDITYLKDDEQTFISHMLLSEAIFPERVGNINKLYSDNRSKFLALFKQLFPLDAQLTCVFKNGDNTLAPDTPFSLFLQDGFRQFSFLTQIEIVLSQHENLSKFHEFVVKTQNKEKDNILVNDTSPAKYYGTTLLRLRMGNELFKLIKCHAYFFTIKSPLLAEK